MTHPARWMLPVLLWLTSAVPVMAAESMQFEAHDSIRSAVKQYLMTELQGLSREPKISVGHIDSRLRLRACGEPLTAYMPAGGRTMGNITVGVRCVGPKPWSLIVQARVEVLESVVVSSRPLSRNEVLKADDLELAERDLGSLTGGYYQRLEEVVGLKLKRSLRAGLPLQRHMLVEPIAIKRGDKVAIKASGASLEVQMNGVALDAGAKGDTIRVRNLSSKREIEAQVRGPGVVEVRY